MSIAERPTRIARNIVFNSATAAIGVAAGFVTSIVIARGLGPTDTGVYVLVIWTTIVAITIVAKGLAFSIVKFVAQQDLRSARKTVTSMVGFALRAELVLALAGALALVACSGLLADLFDTPDAQPYFALAALLVVSTALIEICAAPIMGLERQGLLVPLVATHGLALLVGAVLVIKVFDGGIGELVTAQILVGLGTLVLYLLALSRVTDIRPRAAIDAALRRRITSYAASMTVTLGLGLVVWQRSEIFILGIFTESSEVAFYSIAYAMSEALQGIVPVAFALAVFPNITRAVADRDHQFARRAYENSLRLTAMAVLPIAVGGALLSASAIDVLYGPEFSDAAGPLAVLLFSAGAQRIAYNSSVILLGGDRERLVMLFTGAWAVLNVAVALILIPRYGIAGATAANATTQFSAVVAAHFLVRRTAGFGFPTAGLIRVAAASVPLLVAVAAVVVLVDEDLATLIIGITIALPAYAFGLWATCALEPLERQYLAARLRPILSLRRQ